MSVELAAWDDKESVWRIVPLHAGENVAVLVLNQETGLYDRWRYADAVAAGKLPDSGALILPMRDTPPIHDLTIPPGVVLCDDGPMVDRIRILAPTAYGLGTLPEPTRE